MTRVVLCYGQRAEAQQLAGAGQTAGVGMVRLVLGEVAFDGPRERPAGVLGVPARARGDCIQSRGRNELNTLLN